MGQPKHLLSQFEPKRHVPVISSDRPSFLKLPTVPPELENRLNGKLERFHVYGETLFF